MLASRQRAPGATPHRVVWATVAAAVTVVLIAGCAAGANPAASPAGYGFWWGLWHGIILPVTFVVSLFTDTVTIYEVDNSGNWYDFGFVLALALFSGPVLAGRRR